MSVPSQFSIQVMAIAIQAVANQLVIHISHVATVVSFGLTSVGRLQSAKESTLPSLA